MSESERSRSPFAGMLDFSARTPVRVLSPDEIKRLLAEHRLYLETEYYEGHRANFASADLAGRDFSGLNLRGIKMDRALLSGADFTGAHLQSANLVGAIAEQACFDRDDTHLARIIHATAARLPTALTFGGEMNVDGRALLVAYAAGMETAIRVGAAAKGGFHHTGFHATGVVAHFSASVVAARLLNLHLEPVDMVPIPPL
jgi:2-methylcitrate dehydratase PrpD